MKAFFATLTLLLIVTAGHAGLLLSYVGNKTVRVINDASCTAVVRLKWDGNGGATDTTFTLAPQAATNIFLPGLQVGDRVRAKSENSCSSGPGWVELIIPSVLALRPPSLAPLPPPRQPLFYVFNLHGQLVDRTTDRRKWGPGYFYRQ